METLGAPTLASILCRPWWDNELRRPSSSPLPPSLSMFWWRCRSPFAAAVRPAGLFDRTVGLLASFGMAFPPFVAGILLLTLFSVHLGWLPQPAGTCPCRQILFKTFGL